MTTQELIDKTKQLIAIPSTADNPRALREALQVIEDIVVACPGVTIERFEQNGKPSFLAYRGKKRPKEFDVLLNGHLDVVPGTPEQFQPYEKNGKLYGRGALDMKGTTTVLTDLFCELVNNVPYHLALQVVTDEEMGGYDCVKPQLDDGVRAKFVIMGEYANDRYAIYNAARGLCWAEISFKGKSAHGGHLWNGTNALLKAGDFAGAVLRRYPTPDKETWTTTASVAGLSTPNDTYNKVPDHAVLKIDFRFTQEDPVFQSRETLEEFISSLDPDAKLVNVAVFEPAVNVESFNPYVQGLSRALTKVTKAEPKFLGRPAASDGRHFALVNNDIVEFGLYGAHPHSDEEWVELKSFEEYRAIMREFLHQPIPKNLKQKPGGFELTLKLLEEFVGMPTVTEDKLTNRSMIRTIKRFLQERGMHTEDFESNGYHSLLATTRPGNKRPTVLLSAHTDVVPANASDFSLTTKNGKLYGRGVMDMKFSIASYLGLVDELKDQLQNYDFGILITSDEEVGGRDGVAAAIKHFKLRPKVAVVPDGGENWRVETFAKGVQWIKLEASGTRAHASRPWEGESAISKLLAAIREIETLAPANPKPEDTLLSVGTIEGGNAPNQIAGSASAILDIRHGSQVDYDKMYPAIEKICRRHDVKPVLMVSDPPCVNDPKDPFIKPFIDAISRVTGKQHDTTFSLAASDGRFFSAIGVPCIIVEPPSGARHKDNEWLSVKGFRDFNNILQQYMRLIAFAPVAKGQKARVSSAKPQYAWYVTFGSGLWKEHFMRSITGGQVPGGVHTYSGCSDRSAPLKDTFTSLPYQLFFAKECPLPDHHGLPHAFLDTKADSKGHTIARAYLITLEQFEQIAAQENHSKTVYKLPVKQATIKGHATIGDGSGPYDELLYCGSKDGYPMFTLTTPKTDLERTTEVPESYLTMLHEGLSQNTEMDRREVISYLLDIPGVADTYQPHSLPKFNKKAGV